MAKGKEKAEGTEGGGKSGKGGLIKIVLGAVLLLGTGAGGAYGAYAMGLFGEAGGEHKIDEPKLVLKDEEDPYAPASKDKDKEGSKTVYGEGGSKYRTA